jgi:hypothetical protein
MQSVTEKKMEANPKNKHQRKNVLLNFYTTDFWQTLAIELKWMDVDCFVKFMAF